MSEDAGKKKQKPKKGRVVRLNPDLITIISEEQKDEETVSDTVRRLLGLTGEINYVLPSDIHRSVEDARGAAVLRAVRAKQKKAERPVPVRPVK